MERSVTLFALLSIGLAIALAANAFLGPLVGDVIDYRYTTTYENQLIGLDAFTLIVVAPSSLVL